MNSSKVVALLLVLNFGLFAGILVYVKRARLAEAISADETQDSPVASASSTPSPGWSNGNMLTTVVVETNQFHWAQLESEDYRTYVERLRSIGCPEETLRDIIIADLDKLLAPEIAATYGRRKDLNYWHPEEQELLNDVNPDDVRLKLRELEKRKRDIIRELVNADLARERMRKDGQEDYYERRLVFLADEDRRTEVRELLERYDEAEQAIREKEETGEEVLSAGDRLQLSALRREREEELDRMLTPQEKEGYELWLSPTANEVRHALYGMNATEAEFLAIYRPRKEFQDTWGSREPELMDAESRQELEMAMAEVENTIRESLGEERYYAYQRGQDDDFHLLSSLVTRFALPNETAGEVYEYKKVALGFKEQVRSDPALTPQQKEEALNAIAEETNEALRAALGTRAYRYYMSTGQGRWATE